MELEEARRLLGKKSSNLSDDEIKNLIENMRTLVKAELDIIIKKNNQTLELTNRNEHEKRSRPT